MYNYLIGLYPRLTVKILLGYAPDGLDLLTIILGEGTEYDYKLLNLSGFRESELKRHIEELNINKANSETSIS
jgi:hypothetical protein